ncbi:hypothetical protein J132_10313, partial [Termitomyces sp. J132]
RRHWKKSLRFSHQSLLNKALPSKKYLNLVESLVYKQSAILTQLHTGHLPLNQHLFCIHKAESPVCPYCHGLIVESMCHFLLECLQYQHKWHVHLTCLLKCKAESISFILSSSPPATNLS